MRVTTNMTANTNIYNLQKSQTSLLKLQEQLATEQNINRPSDAPIDSQQLLDIADTVKATDQYSSNIIMATTFLKVTDTALNSISGFISQAKTLVASISDGNNDPGERQTARDQLVSIKQQIVDMANTQYGDRYVFGGAVTGTPPFSTANNNYSGDSTQLPYEVAKNSTAAMNITGDRLLLGVGSSPSYGSIDILTTFDNLITAVGDSSTPSNAAAIDQGSKDLLAAGQQVDNAQIDVAARMTRLDNMSKIHTNTKSNLLAVAGDIQSVDLAKLGVQLNQQQTAYSAALSASAKITKMSLLDYL